METEEGKKEDKACCSKGKCCCKAFGAIALLLVGGIGGYFAGRRCSAGAARTAPAASAPVQAPAK